MKSAVININNEKENARLTHTTAHKFMLVAEIVSFIFYGMIFSIMQDNGYYQIFRPNEIIASEYIIDIILWGLIAWLIFEAVFLVYRFIVGFNMFSYIIPSVAVKDTFRLAVVFRNILVGIGSLLFIKFPIIYQYLVIVDLLISAWIFYLFLNKLLKNYADLVVVPFVFRSYALPAVSLLVAYVIAEVVRCAL